MAAWCRESGEPRGEVLPLNQVWALARGYCGDRLDPDFRGLTKVRVREIFTSAGLTSDFWLG